MDGIRNKSPGRYAPARQSGQSHVPANVTRSPQSYPTQGPAPTSTPGYPEQSQYAGRSSRTSPSSHHQTPSPQEQAAYSARTGTVGYGRASRTPSPPPPAVPPWGVKPNIQQFCADVAKENKGTRLTQFTAQGSCPGTNGGVCNAMTEEWIKQGARNSSMDQASAAFTQSLHHGMPQLIDRQERFNGRMDALRNEMLQNKAESEQHMQDLQELTPHIQAMQAGRLSPKKANQVRKWVDQLESDMQATQQKVANTGARLAEAEKNEAARLGGRLPHTQMVSNKNITHDFAHDLDAATQRPGFYSLSVHSKDGGPGHVMGIEVGPHGCKFMDPNTGEFVMKDRKAMLNVATDHIASLYMNSNDRFSVSHFG
ncbi:YopT-type cysteine protease domain-containing protein [Cystobacter fuscus]|nr:YopT-type cysteine protease domain-containing protein [Cystobacter fuscus]